MCDIVKSLVLDDLGSGRPVLLLHGGGGPGTVAPWGERLAAQRAARVIVPTHPGFGGTPRPAGIASIRGLAELYAALLDELDLDDVVVVGNSIGGWIAAELAVLGPPRVSTYVLVDAVGVEVTGHPVVDFFSLTPAEIAQHSYADPATYGIDPSTLTPEALAAMAGNRAALQVYGGTTMTDPTLLDRLGEVRTPTLVVWGEADRIATPAYGEVLAAAVPGAGFRLLEDTGHLPQIESPEELIETVWEFVERPSIPARATS